MAQTEMQKVVQSSQEVVQQPSQQHTGEALEKMGGFMAVKGFIPAIADMNPAKKATKSIFLNEKKFHAKREALAGELKSWIEVLSSDKANVVEYVEECKKMERMSEKTKEDCQNAAGAIARGAAQK